MKKILITGGTGFIGTQLVSVLLRTYEVTILSRQAKPTKQANLKIIKWKSTDKWLLDIIEETDIVINLAGEGIASGYWTSSKKNKILSSRVITTRRLVKAINEAKNKPELFVSASAIGIYGSYYSENDLDQEITEQAKPGAGFLAEVCKQWETEALQAKNIRVVIPRIGLVLGDQGLLKPLKLVYKLGIGGPVGSGKQWLSWITLEDTVNTILYAIENQNMSGPINVTAPQPVRMNEFSKTLAKSLKRPNLFKVPEWPLKFLLKDMASLMCGGKRVLPQKLIESNFKFECKELNRALDKINNK